MSAQGITTNAVQRADLELSKMKGSLKGWLKYRTLNDAVATGRAPARMPIDYARRVIASHRDAQLEQDLASKLHALLGELMPGVALPNADVRSNPSAAVQLAQIAVSGKAPVTEATPVGGVMTSHPWLWPVLIVGGLLLAVTTAVKTAADVAKEKERYACIQAGACTDYGFWLKAGGITVLAWFAWKELGLGDVVRNLIKKGRS
jgi:hypothetical protein